uniref:Folliculin-interacting protein 2 n=1 Tax=Romanomermis culicivorax TaxID=13658 RepID=A0A915HIM1_ROMCU
MRLIIFRENEWKERRLMFDSASIGTQPLRKNSSPAKHSSPHADLSPLSHSRSSPFPMDDELSNYQNYFRSFIKSTAELMFGSVGMNNKGDTTKLHELKSSSQIMLTHIFDLSAKKRKVSRPEEKEHTPVTGRASQNHKNFAESDSDSQYSTINSMDSFIIITDRRRQQTANIRIPNIKSSYENFTCVRPKNATSSPDSQGSIKDCSMSSTPQTPTPITASYKSLQLTFMKNSFENIYQRRFSQPVAGILPSQLVKERCQKRAQIGIAVLFSVDNENHVENCFRRFLFSHMQLVEKELLFLKRHIDASCYCKKADFIFFVTKAWKEFYSSIKSLYESPRLSCPLWTILTTGQDDSLTTGRNGDIRHSDESFFIATFCELAEVLDRKEANFFLSTALTIFLTFHSGWVSSVAPPTLSSPLDPSSSINIPPLTKKNIKMVANYCSSIDRTTNPFICQLLDLWSVFNSHHRSLRTTFIGNDRLLLTKLIYVFTYFLRCNNLKRCQRFDESVPHCNHNDRKLSSSDDDGFINDNVKNYDRNSEPTSDYGTSIDSLSSFLYDKSRCPSMEIAKRQQRKRNLTGSSNIKKQRNKSEKYFRFIDKTSCDNVIFDTFSSAELFANCSRRLSSSCSNFEYRQYCMYKGDSCDPVTPTVIFPSNNFFDDDDQKDSSILSRLFSSAKVDAIRNNRNRSNCRRFDSDRHFRRYSCQLCAPRSERDLNNNWKNRISRFENPGHSLQTSLQIFIDDKTNNDDCSDSSSFYNPNFALTAFLTDNRSPPFCNRSWNGKYERSRHVVESYWLPRLGRPRQSRDEWSENKPSKEELAIRNGLVRTALQSDSSTAIDILSVLAADTRDW